MIFNWDDLAPDLLAFLMTNSYMRGLRAERSDPYEVLAGIWFPKQCDINPQCRAFMVDAVLGAWRKDKPSALAELVAGPCYGMLRLDKIWEVKRHEE